MSTKSVDDEAANVELSQKNGGRGDAFQDEERPFQHGNSIGSHNSGLALSQIVIESWHAVEVGALGMDDDSDDDEDGSEGGDRHFASLVIASRLGGSISSNRIRPSPALSSPKTPPPSERTRLLQKNDNSNNKSEQHHAPSSPPPLVKWIGIALSCALCYALYNISIKKGSSSIHPILGGVILQFVAALLGTTLLISMIWTGGDTAKKKLRYDRNGLLWSVGAGLWVGTAEIVSFVVSGMGVPATSSIPIIIGGSVCFGSILGVLLLGEQVMCIGWTGVVLLCVGIVMVATDPGDKVEEGGGGVDGVILPLPPPLAIWIGPALFCALSYALYNICIKLGSASINPIAGAVVLQFVAAIFGTCILVLLILFEPGTSPEFDADGIFWACWAGIFVGGAELLSFCVSGLGVPASQSIPVLIGGSVGFGAVLGIVMLGEVLEIQGWAGVLILMAGIALVAVDPGEKVEGH